MPHIERAQPIHVGGVSTLMHVSGDDNRDTDTPLDHLKGIYRTVAMVAAGYHGYKRSRSLGWALAWAALGRLFPIPTLGVAFFQGFGESKGSGADVVGEEK